MFLNLKFGLSQMGHICGNAALVCDPSVASGKENVPPGGIGLDDGEKRVKAGRERERKGTSSEHFLVVM